jgi:hypothetical protein
MLFLIRDDDHSKGNGRTLGARLMEQGHTVFLSDNDDDLEFFREVVDAFVEISPVGDEPRAVGYALGDKRRVSRAALKQRAVLSLPADDAALSKFAGKLSTPSAAAVQRRSTP